MEHDSDLGQPTEMGQVWYEEIWFGFIWVTLGHLRCGCSPCPSVTTAHPALPVTCSHLFPIPSLAPCILTNHFCSIPAYKVLLSTCCCRPTAHVLSCCAFLNKSVKTVWSVVHISESCFLWAGTNNACLTDTQIMKIQKPDRENLLGPWESNY